MNVSTMLRGFVALLAISQALADPAANAETAARGTTGCERDHEGGHCRISWNFPASTRAYHWIEEMSPETSSWRRVQGPIVSRLGSTDAPVAGGRLYRVVACDDPQGTRSCVGSTASWALIQPESVDEIPRYVDDNRGVKLYVSKKLDLGSQKQQYNIYLMVRLVNGVRDMRAIPPMTMPRFGPNVAKDVVIAEGTEDEITEHLVYGNYEALRAFKLDQQARTADQGG